MPSGQPSASPTSKPSKLDLLTINSLEAEWTSAYTKARLQAYMAYYVIAFIALFLILFLADKSGILKNRATKLSDSAFDSEVYLPKRTLHLASDEASEVADPSDNAVLLEHLKRENTRRMAAFEERVDEGRKRGAFSGGNKADALGVDDNDDVQANGTDDNDADDGAVDVRLVKILSHGSVEEPKRVVSKQNPRRVVTSQMSSFFGQFTQTVYSDEFNEYLFMGRCYLGCDDFLCPGGHTLPLIGVKLRPGVYEDFLLYCFNNHTLLACVLCTKEAVFSRAGRRLVFLIEHAFGFFVSNFMSNIFIMMSLPASMYSSSVSNYFTQVIFDVIFTSQIAAAIGLAFMFLYRKSREARLGEYVALRWLLVPPVLGAFLMLLVLAALLTHDVHVAMNIANYLYQVIVAGAIIELICIMMKFESQYHFAVYILWNRVCLLNIGKLYLERLLRLESREGVDYVDLSYVALRGLVRIDRVVQKKYADSRQWHVHNFKRKEYNGKSASVVLNTRDGQQKAQAVRHSQFTQVNPLHKVAGKRTTMTFDDDVEMMRPSSGAALRSVGSVGATYDVYDHEEQAQRARSRRDLGALGNRKNMGAAAPGPADHSYLSNMNAVLSMMNPMNFVSRTSEGGNEARKSHFEGRNPMAGGGILTLEQGFAEDGLPEEEQRASSDKPVIVDADGNLLPMAGVRGLKNRNLRGSFAAKLAFFGARTQRAPAPAVPQSRGMELANRAYRQQHRDAPVLHAVGHNPLHLNPAQNSLLHHAHAAAPVAHHNPLLNHNPHHNPLQSHLRPASKKSDKDGL